MTLASGLILAGRYRVEQPLGQGGMGTVFRGWDLDDERPCAMKALDHADPAALQQFAVEAHLLQVLRSPHLPRFYAYLAAPSPVLVMEYVAGEDLETRLQRQGPLTEVEALRHIRHILEALLHLHGQQPAIIHRDIKPTNVRIDALGNAWLLDLGIAKRQPAHTAAGALAASMAYAPLEQLQQRPTDERSDLFALGATLYHLVTGEPPVSALAREVGTPLVSPVRLAPQLSTGCAHLIHQALQLEPAARFSSAITMHAAVEALLDPSVLSRDHLAAQLQRRLAHHMPTAIVAQRVLPAQQAVFGQVDPPVPPLLSRAMGGHPLYSHQAEAVERARTGRDIVVVTGTASGKSLCYNLPILERCLTDDRVGALYLFPIKALINDQAQALERTIRRLGHPEITVGRLDGDLDQSERLSARHDPPRLALSNPDFVHWMLAQHPSWRSFWARLQFLVLDEVHVYRGVFGSHVAHLLRRLLRICRHYSGDRTAPQIICCSATIANPAEHVQQLTGRLPHVIDRDGAARPRRHVLFWQPMELGHDERRSLDGDAVLVTTRAVAQAQHVITFARSRQEVEQLLVQARRGAVELGHAPAAYRAYRSGYTRTDRERIEEELRTGQVQGVFTTTALELGLDIGGLDMSVLTGLPGSRMSFWQQAGRAGRRGADAHVILLGAPNPLDQYFLQHPDDLLYGPSEEAVVDLSNTGIAVPHLCAMAREWPIQAHELASFAPELLACVRQLIQDGTLIAQSNVAGETEYVYGRSDLPHGRVNFRSAGTVTYRIICEPGAAELGTIAPPQLYREMHVGAIYYHQGESYRVTGIDALRLEVRVRPEPHDHVTRPVGTLDVQLRTVVKTYGLSAGLATVTLGEIEVIETVTGFREYERRRLRMLREDVLPAPLQHTLATVALWLDLDPSLQSELNRLVTPAMLQHTGGDSALRTALHGVEHLLLGLIPTVALCDRRDLGSSYAERYGYQGVARVYVYDGYPGGIGLAARGYRHVAQLLARAYAVVTQCGCHEGCPYCIQAPWCYEDNRQLDKGATIYLLARLLGKAP